MLQVKLCKQKWNQCIEEKSYLLMREVHRRSSQASQSEKYSHSFVIFLRKLSFKFDFCRKEAFEFTVVSNKFPWTALKRSLSIFQKPIESKPDWLDLGSSRSVYSICTTLLSIDHFCVSHYSKSLNTPFCYSMKNSNWISTCY